MFVVVSGFSVRLRPKHMKPKGVAPKPSVAGRVLFGCCPLALSLCGFCAMTDYVASVRLRGCMVVAFLIGACQHWGRSSMWLALWWFGGLLGVSCVVGQLRGALMRDFILRQRGSEVRPIVVEARPTLLGLLPLVAPGGGVHKPGIRSLRTPSPRAEAGVVNTTQSRCKLLGKCLGRALL